ncbi:low temperature requirement protein A [Micromonospora sp. NPDC050397]|uniref:low temperature requirement protein A n=1 Tax=Micromonospora sp. NPDC050397 TaxID=3364279 RepID=UPI00384B7C13
MATGGPADAEAAAAAEEERERPAFLELFFDLVFIVALISLAEKLVGEMTWTGAVQTLTLLLAFTMIWALTAWAGSTFNPNHVSVQPQIVAAMAGSLVLAAAVPEAYADHGLLFAVTYVLIHLGSGAYNTVVHRRGPTPTQSRRVLVWELAASIGWIAGAMVGGTARVVLWAVAVGLEYLGTALGWPVRGLGSSRSRESRPSGRRISERYRQFVIIALGVALFVVGRAFTEKTSYPLSHTWALVIMFVIAVLMWRIYIYRAGEVMTVAIDRSNNPARLSQYTAVAHLIMVAGIIGTASASQLVVEHPLEPTPSAWATAILGGPALFLIGRGFFDYVVFSRVSRSRVAGLVLLAAVAPAIGLLRPVTIALLVMVILFVIAALNLLSTRVHRRDPAPPRMGGRTGPD